MCGFRRKEGVVIYGLLYLLIYNTQDSISLFYHNVPGNVISPIKPHDMQERGSNILILVVS